MLRLFLSSVTEHSDLKRPVGVGVGESQLRDSVGARVKTEKLMQVAAGTLVAYVTLQCLKYQLVGKGVLLCFLQWNLAVKKDS